MFHNTINATNNEVAEFNVKIKTQNDRILEFFKNNQGKQYTPFDVQKALDMYYHPITSIRRAISDLCADNKLIKCNEQRTGPYGKKNYTWKYNNIPEPTQLILFND